MMFGNKPLSSALVAMVTLSIAVSAALDPIEQSLFARDGQDFSKSKEASGKTATPVNVGKTPISQDAVAKLVGADLHSTTSPAPASAPKDPLSESKITALAPSPNLL